MRQSAPDGCRGGLLPLPSSDCSETRMLEGINSFLYQLGEIGELAVDFIRYLFRRPFEGRLLLEQFDEVGFQSLTVVNLTALSTGMVLALQMGQFLVKFGAK